MANHSATKKDVRQSTKRNERNRYYGKTTRNAIRDFKASDKTVATEQLPKVSSMIDKLAKKGIVHKNKGSRSNRPQPGGWTVLALVQQGERLVQAGLLGGPPKIGNRGGLATGRGIQRFGDGQTAATPPRAGGANGCNSIPIFGS